MKCMKCQRETDKVSIHRIRLNSGEFYLCPRCYHQWEQIYVIFRRTGKTGYWELGWAEFLKLPTKFNPSYRKVKIEVKDL